MTSGGTLVYFCMLVWIHFLAVSSGARSGGQTVIPTWSVVIILTLVTRKVVHTSTCMVFFLKQILTSDLGVPLITQSNLGTENNGMANCHTAIHH